MIARNSDSLIFYGIAEIFIDRVGLERNWACKLELSFLSKRLWLAWKNSELSFSVYIHVVQKMMTQNFHF